MLVLINGVIRSTVMIVVLSMKTTDTENAVRVLLLAMTKPISPPTIQDAEEGVEKDQQGGFEDDCKEFVPPPSVIGSHQVASPR